MALDREVQYLLNKAKFAKPRPKPRDKNETRAEPPLNASASDQGERIIPPPGEAGCLVPGRGEPPFPLASHLYSAFPSGQTEDAKPIPEPEKETRELGKLGIWTSLSLGIGKRAGTAWFWTAHEVILKTRKCRD